MNTAFVRSRPQFVTFCAQCGQDLTRNTPRPMQSNMCPDCRAWDDLLYAVAHQPAELWTPGVVLPDLHATTSHQAIAELVEMLALQNAWSEQLRETLIKTYLFDDRAASTALDRGLAILSITHPAVEETTLSVARSIAGIDFQALDGESSRVFLLLVSPPQPPVMHLRLTAIAAGLLRTHFYRRIQSGKLPSPVN
jgi:mannitol/fructose-specific phosphotransferase system IIA component (Ntr-type)